MQERYQVVMVLVLSGSLVACANSQIKKNNDVVLLPVSKKSTQVVSSPNFKTKKDNAFDLPADIAESAVRSDPFERYNRAAFGFNQAVDKVILKPVATVYRHALPWPVRTGVSHFFSNIAELPSFVGHVLRGEPNQAGTTAVRFAVNSTVGLFGVLDVATKMGLPERRQDVGTALAKWGDKHSPYLVLPLLGPSTLRDAFAVPLNYAVGVYPHLYPSSLRYKLIALNIVRFRSELLDSDKTINQASLDRYAFERDAYLQLRNKMILDNSQ